MCLKYFPNWVFASSSALGSGDLLPISEKIRLQMYPL